MLALTRRSGESIQIFPSRDIDPDMTVAELFKDGSIKIMIMTREHNNQQVRLGIQAPGALTVLRDELKKDI